jgi:ribA/ribD-fused uncharacterized protein
LHLNECSNGVKFNAKNKEIIMTTPISGRQNTSLDHIAPVSPSIIRPEPRLLIDSLEMAHTSHGFSLSSIWDAIVRCFRQLFGITTSPPHNQHINSIAQVAARDHFLWFYKQEENQLTAFLGNFHSCPITLWGIRFKCAEAAFQAAKFMPQTAVMARFQNLDGDASFRLGRQLSGNWTSAQNAQWRNNNLTFMREIVRAKFNQNPDLKALLLATGDAYLVEHIPRAREGRDPFWSDNFNGTGQNMLGQILMETRGVLGGRAGIARNQQYNQFLSRR